MTLFYHINAYEYSIIMYTVYMYMPTAGKPYVRFATFLRIAAWCGVGWGGVGWGGGAC